MKASNFKTFMEILTEAKENDDIFYRIYLWFDLTEKQLDKVAITLIERGYPVIDGKVKLHNGIDIKISKSAKEEMIKRTMFSDEVSRSAAECLVESFLEK